MTYEVEELEQLARLVNQEAERVTNLAFQKPVQDNRLEAALWWREFAVRFNKRLGNG